MNPANKYCVSCMKREAVTRIGKRNMCQQCKDARDKAVKAAKK